MSPPVNNLYEIGGVVLSYWSSVFITLLSKLSNNFLFSTLVKRELVKRWSNPAKFTITDQGLELANRILAVENGTGKLTYCQ
jgi:hypothetical protein